jgi:4-amino-4-deoxy-L-arabinose transferase-like glycosyltransferase
MSIDTRNLLLGVLVTLGTMLVAWPFAEGGYIDDFSYIHMAKTLAETGRFAYNGWPTTMLGIQVWWGAAWVWLFGFSFAIVRLSVWPLALGAVAMVYLLARRARLTPTDSLFAAMLTGMSPHFILNAPSFMTDAPGLFFLFACLYAFARAVEDAEQVPAHSSRALAWLFVGMLCGVLGGTIRQTVWFAPLAGAAVLFLWPGVSKRMRLAAFVCGAVGLASIVVGIRWFNSQPYAIPTRLPASTALGIADLVSVTRTMAAGVLTAIVPMFFYRLAALRRWRREQLPWLGNSAVVDLIVLLAVAWVLFRATVVGWFALLSQAIPAVEPAAWLLQGLRKFLMLLLALLLMATLLRQRGVILSAVRRMPPAIVIPLVYLLPYSAAVMQASRMIGELYPRYYLPYVPLLACAVLWGVRAAFTTAVDRRIAIVGWVSLAVVALPEVRNLHHMFADCRARLAAISYLESNGVARDRIMAGWQIDGWEQIERAGYLNDYRIRVPRGAFKPLKPDGYPKQLMLRDRMSALTPEYIVTDDPSRFPGDRKPFPRFPYTSWWPPYRREIVICHQVQRTIPKSPDVPAKNVPATK